MEQDTRHHYTNILRQSLLVSDFYKRLAFLLDGDPYFIPGHLEMLWHSLERKDMEMYKKVLSNALFFVGSIYTDKKLRLRLSEKWSRFEIEALVEILAVARKANTLHPQQRLLAAFQSIIAGDIITPKTAVSPREPRFLKQVESVGAIQQLQKEIDALAPYWWQVQTGRQDIVTHHQNTHGVLLRALPVHNTYYAPHDGVHESVATHEVMRLPRLAHTVLDFAKRHQLGLGRVAVVALDPHAHVFRHFDAEEHLVGRNRYHLVLQAGEKNLLASGDEQVNPRPGEIWFFDNKVMHRAYNGSPTIRIHVIFDGYPLQESNSALLCKSSEKV